MVTRTLFAGLLAGAVLYAAPALACPVLVKASPRVGSTIDEAVPQVSLHFSGPVDAARSMLEVKDDQGRSVVTGKIAGSGAPVDTVSVPVTLHSGTYKVTWHVHCNCEDGQNSIYPGDYSFTVK